MSKVHQTFVMKLNFRVSYQWNKRMCFKLFTVKDSGTFRFLRQLSALHKHLWSFPSRNQQWWCQRKIELIRETYVWQDLLSRNFFGIGQSIQIRWLGWNSFFKANLFCSVRLRNFFNYVHISTLDNKYFTLKKEDPLQQGYSRVNQDGTLSNSTTSTSLDTVVIDTSADNISNSPKLQQQKPRATFSPILESESSSNPFRDDLKELAKRSKKSNLKGGHISFGEDEEDTDKFDEDAFKKRREHFQKTKSRSEHKSIILRVSFDRLKLSRRLTINETWILGFASLSRRWPWSQPIPGKETCVTRRQIIKATREFTESNIVWRGWVWAKAEGIPGKKA